MHYIDWEIFITMDKELSRIIQKQKNTMNYLGDKEIGKPFSKSENFILKEKKSNKIIINQKNILNCHHIIAINGLFFLGLFYSRGDIFVVDLPRAIQYFLKSIENHYNEVNVFRHIDKTIDFKNIYNNYYSHSQNELGLIYLTYYKDFEKASQYIKEAALSEYPFAQNNFGLLNEIYYNEIGNAEYMYL